MIFLATIVSATLLNIKKKSVVGNKYGKILVNRKPDLLLNDHVFLFHLVDNFLNLYMCVSTLFMSIVKFAYSTFISERNKGKQS